MCYLKCKNQFRCNQQFMSDQFSLESNYSFDWLKSADQLTEKNFYKTNSEVSKDDFLEEILQQNSNRLEMQELNRKTQKKQRNKQNARNYRDKKKQNIESIKDRLQYLEQENQLLKKQKQCRHCGKSFDMMAKCEKSHPEKMEVEEIQSNENKKNFEVNELKFQQFNMNEKKQKQHRNGKIWIALGILLMVLGFSLYGFDGNKSLYKEIELEKNQMNKWVEQYKTKEKGGDFFNVKMKFKPDKSENPILTEVGNIMALTYRQKPEALKPNEKEENIQINKDLLFGIHAEIDDIGFYL